MQQEGVAVDVQYQYGVCVYFYSKAVVSAAALHLVLLAYAYLCTNRWWTAISLKASGRGERGGNVCSFGVINDRTISVY